MTILDEIEGAIQRAEPSGAYRENIRQGACLGCKRRLGLGDRVFVDFGTGLQFCTEACCVNWHARTKATADENKKDAKR